ncbi:MAG: nitroreductase [Clostridiales Family XIII bacterium]|jgi:nitroreductase|nr:nitroreductase [Clostridiales Family XIII bacterium]
MNVIEALYARHSTRAFLADPVEKDKLLAVSEAAVRAPSWANSQPWEVFVATGATLDNIKRAYLEKYEAKEAPAPETPLPTEWPQASKDRRKLLDDGIKQTCGEAAKQFGPLNRGMFNAPAVAFVCMDKRLSPWSLYDLGAYAQCLMLAALEKGLGAIPAITLVLYPDVLRRELRIPDALKVVIGIAIGYIDKRHDINKFVSGRIPFAETTHFLD